MRENSCRLDCAFPSSPSVADLSHLLPCADVEGLSLLQLGQDCCNACVCSQGSSAWILFYILQTWASAAVWPRCTYTPSCVSQSCCCCLFSLTSVTSFAEVLPCSKIGGGMEHVETLCISPSDTSFPWIPSGALRWWKFSERTCSCYLSSKLHVSGKACFNFCSTCFIKVGTDGCSNWTVWSCTAG